MKTFTPDHHGHAQPWGPPYDSVLTNVLACVFACFFRVKRSQSASSSALLKHASHPPLVGLVKHASAPQLATAGSCGSLNSLPRISTPASAFNDGASSSGGGGGSGSGSGSGSSSPKSPCVLVTVRANCTSRLEVAASKATDTSKTAVAAAAGSGDASASAAAAGPELVGFVLLDPLWEGGQEVGYVTSMMRMKRSAHAGEWAPESVVPVPPAGRPPALHPPSTLFPF
jgi:hypothetical protein